MTDEQIEYLKKCIIEGKRVLWIVNEAREIVSVASCGDEPSEVGYFKNGEYIALYNVNPDELWATFPMFP